MTTQQGQLRLFIQITAITCVGLALAGFLGRDGGVQAVGIHGFLSPFFAVVLLFCGLVLYAGTAIGRHSRPFALMAIGAIVLARWAAHWSALWVNGRVDSANFATAVVVVAAIAAFFLNNRGAPLPLSIRRRSLLVAITGMSVSILIAYALIDADRRSQRAYGDRSASTMARAIQDKIRLTETLMTRLGQRWSSINHLPSNQFIQREFDSYLWDFDFFRSLAILERGLPVAIEISDDGDSRPIQEMLEDPDVRVWLEHVYAADRRVLVTAEDVAWHGTGLIVVPLLNPYMLGWFVAARIDVAALLHQALAQAEGMAEFAVYYGEHVLYRSAPRQGLSNVAAGRITVPVHHDFSVQLAYRYGVPQAGIYVLPEFIILAGMLVTFFLISSQRLAHVARERAAQLNHGALHDPLTGLPNRRMFEETLHSASVSGSASSQSVGAVCIDLDGTKLINDSMGHTVGDRLLVEVAQRLRIIAGKGAFVARLAGDEFVVAFIGSDMPGLQERATHVISELARPYLIAGSAIRITASAGIAMGSLNGPNPMQALLEADQAMSEAKKQGRNTWCAFTPDLRARVAERVGLRTDLQNALDAEQLQLYYQPIIDSATQRPTAIEALVRWPHPVHGYVSPSVFIPLAEQMGQIVRVTEWVLGRACADSHALLDNGFRGLPVVVNISPLYFQRIGFVHDVQNALREAALPVEQLQLEITESVLLDDAETSIKKLARLSELGIKASIDDFGTGYSSLSYLKNLPVAKIKIDHSFIKDIETSADDAAIVSGIIAIAQQLGLTVVAEGVETKAQLAKLRNLRCDEFQGYLFARPMPFGDLLSALNRGFKL